MHAINYPLPGSTDKSPHMAARYEEQARVKRQGTQQMDALAKLWEGGLNTVNPRRRDDGGEIGTQGPGSEQDENGIRWDSCYRGTG